MNRIACIAQQLARLFAQVSSTRVVSLSQSNKCQCSERACDASIVSLLAIEGKAGLAERIRPLIVAEQPHGEPEICLRLRQTKGIIKSLLLRHQFFKQGACAIMSALIARKLGTSKKHTGA